MINIRNTKRLSLLAKLYKQMEIVSELTTLQNRLTNLLWSCKNTSDRRDVQMLLNNVKQKVFNKAYQHD